jgi:hypothetical protein
MLRSKGSSFSFDRSDLNRDAFLGTGSLLATRVEDAASVLMDLLFPGWKDLKGFISLHSDRRKCAGSLEVLQNVLEVTESLFPVPRTALGKKNWVVGTTTYSH